MSLLQNPLLYESVWIDKWKYDEAERKFTERLSSELKQEKKAQPVSEIVQEIRNLRTDIRSFLGIQHSSMSLLGLYEKIDTLQKDNGDLKKIVGDLRSLMQRVDKRLEALETSGVPAAAAAAAAKSAAVKPAPAANDDDEDEDEDLFGSDDEETSAEAERVKQERLKAYAEKKAKKPGPIAKSNVILDVKPWDDETDMEEMVKLVKSIEMDGLLWGAHKLVPLAFGIKKLQISTVIEDDKVSVDDLEERITAFEDFVQSVDVAAFNKI